MNINQLTEQKSVRMNIFTFIVFAVLIFVLSCLSGCTSDPIIEKQVIVKTEYVYFPVPKNMTTLIVPNPPPKTNDYVGADLEERTVILTNYSLDLLNTTKQLNDRLTAIKVMDDKNRTNIDKLNDQEAQRVNSLLKEK